MTESRPFRIAIHQWDCREQDETGNLASVEAAFEAASHDRADVLALPELWLTGYDLSRTTCSPRDTASDIEAVQSLAKSHRLPVLAGSFLESVTSEPGQPSHANCHVAIDANGDVVSRYRKVHVFGPLREDEFVLAGEEWPRPFELAGIRAGAAICYDLRFAEVFRPLARSGVDLVHVPGQWPLARIDHWRALVCARAVELQAFVVAVNRSGVFGEVEFGGSSMVAGPDGVPVLDAERRIGTFTVEVDIAEAARTRERLPYLDDERRDLGSA